MSKNQNQNGFGLVEALLLVIAIAVVVLVGYYVWHTQKQTDKTLNTAAITSQTNTSAISKVVNPYAGWKTYTSGFEGLNFKYPPNWILTSSKDNGNAPNGEDATFKSPSGFNINWFAPVAGIGGACDPAVNPHIFIDKVIDLSVKGRSTPLYAVVFSVRGNKSLGVVDNYFLSQSGKMPTVGDTGACLLYATLRSKNQNSSGNSDIFMFGNAGQISSSPSNANLTISRYLAQPNIQNTIKIFKSISY